MAVKEHRDGSKVMNRGIAKAKQEQRHAEAVARQEAYDKLTPHQKLGVLDKRLGTELGAKKERARLNKLILKGKTHESQDSDERTAGT